jgi:hypothetical protein
LRLLHPSFLCFLLSLEESFHDIDGLPLDLPFIALDQGFHLLALVFLGETDELLVAFRIRLGVRQQVGGQFLGLGPPLELQQLLPNLEDRLSGCGDAIELLRALRSGARQGAQLKAPHAVDAVEDTQRVLDVLARPVHVAHGGIHDVHLRHAGYDDADHDQDDDRESHKQAGRYFHVLKHGLAP